MKSLKWIVGLMFIGIVTSCLDDEPITNVVYKYNAIDSVQIDTIMPARQITQIKTYFTTQNGCQQFFDYDYTILGNERTVSVIISELQDQSCTLGQQVHAPVLNFKPNTPGNYTFRFWNGVDENGQDLFIIREVEVH